VLLRRSCVWQCLFIQFVCLLIVARRILCFLIYLKYPYNKGTAVAQWLRYSATNRKVAGSIPDGVVGFFH
jgi:hypothetical protein